MNVGISYVIVTVSVMMFALQFFFSDRYEKISGGEATASLMYSFISAVAGIICLLAINGFSLSFTPFTFAVAAASSVNLILFYFCSLKALGKINLSLYSLFSMLGGMMLPFILDLTYYGEKLTDAKAVCVILVVAALILTVKKEEKHGRGYIYYCGIFVLNGMSGVLSKLFVSGDFKKTNEASFSLWIAIISAVLTGTVLLIMRKKVRRPSASAVGLSFGGGALNQVANFLLVIALTSLPASVQYPFVTGGVMITSTVIAAVTGQKLTWREVAAVILSFIGVLALVLL